MSNHSSSSDIEKPLLSREIAGRTFQIYTLATYNTPYYYCKELGRVNHYPTVRQLEGAIKRAIKAGKLEAVFSQRSFIGRKERSS